MSTPLDDQNKHKMESEMKALQLRWKISTESMRLISSYMHNGFKLLEKSCKTCNSILLRDLAGKEYCVACAELNSSALAGDSPKKTVGDKPAVTKPPALPVPGSQAAGDSSSESSSSSSDESSSYPDDGLDYSYEGVYSVASYMRMKSKIDELSKKLEECNELNETRDLCIAIKTCADTAVSIKKLL